MSSFSDDISKSLLIDHKIALASSPEQLSICLDVCESNSELFLIIYTLLEEINQTHPGLEETCSKLQQDYLRLNFSSPSKAFWAETLKEMGGKFSEALSQQWGKTLDNIQSALLSKEFQSPPPDRCHDSRRLFESLASARSISRESDRDTLRKYYPSYFKSDAIPTVSEVEHFICKALLEVESSYAWDYHKAKFGEIRAYSQFFHGDISSTSLYRA